MPSPSESERDNSVRPWVRVFILLLFLSSAFALSYMSTGTIIPTNAQDALIFQDALLFVVLGSAIIEHKFTKPADSLVNSLMGVITLVTVYGVAPRTPWLLLLGYCGLVFLLSVACVASSTSALQKGWQATLARLTFRPAVVLGRARLLYSVLFLFGVFSFYGVQSDRTARLVVFWAAFLALWPLGIPELLSTFRRPSSVSIVGRVVRTDSPNLVRVALTGNSRWAMDAPKLYQQSDGSQSLLIPLYMQTQDNQCLGTGVCVPWPYEIVRGLALGAVYETPDGTSPSEQTLVSYLGGGSGSHLIGFVVEGCSILSLRFETWRPEYCREGLLVYVNVGNKRVYYQLMGGETREETLQSDRHGYQVAVATQLGTVQTPNGFQKFPWLPWMNAPVFAEAGDFGAELQTLEAGDFCYGVIPESQVKVGGPFVDTLDFHTAIIGVTGSGKTELAFDLIRHAVGRGIKVVCIDLTNRYHGRLKDLQPRNLSIPMKLSKELDEKLFEAETGAYGAGKEKKALRDFSDSLRKEISKSITEFLTSSAPDGRVGIISLEEISNTRATLYITEMYLTCLLHFARDYPNKFPKTLVVVEEAHTVMPEPTTMGLGDFDSRGLVGKISQIALQGRKYRVGLLVVAQRTATVSKTVLTQCNTVIALSSFDETTISFLTNFYGAPYASFIPDLQKFHALIFGKGIRSERPLIVAVPYDAKKAAAEAEMSGAKADGATGVATAAIVQT